MLAGGVPSNGAPHALSVRSIAQFIAFEQR